MQVCILHNPLQLRSAQPPSAREGLCKNATLSYGHEILNHARLPIPTLPHRVRLATPL